MSVTAPRRRSPQWLRVLFGTTSAGLAVDVALACRARRLAWVFIYYGAAKLFGAFPGSGGPHGIHQTSLYMAQLPISSPEDSLLCWAGLIEFGGGIAMALGFFTRLAGLALFGDMVMAMITVTWATGINSPDDPPGYQINLALAAMALAVALIGAGRFSLDAVIASAFGRGGEVASSRARVADSEADPERV